MLIEDCTFTTGDDAIAIKAGRDQDAWRIGQKTANIVIRNCRFKSRCNGLASAARWPPGRETVYMYDVVIDRCYSGIYFKSNLDRAGFIRNVSVDFNVVCVRFREDGLIRFETDYHGACGGFHPTVLENFLIRNVTGNKSGRMRLLCPSASRAIRCAISDWRMSSPKRRPFPTCFEKTSRTSPFKNVLVNGRRMDRTPRRRTTSVLKLKTD